MEPEELIEELSACIIDGDPGGAAESAQAAISAGIDPMRILNEGLMAGAAEVGRLFERGEYFLPELMLAGRALKASMEVVKPVLIEKYSGAAGALRGKVVMATVQTDIHDIGKSLVSSMLTAAGFEVTDLGVDVPLKAIIEKAEEIGADIIGLSALLTTSMPFQRDLIELLKARGLRDKYIVLVGGAPVTPEIAARIGADGTAPNAAEAVQLARRLMEAKFAA